MLIRILTGLLILIASYSFGQFSIDSAALKKKLILTDEQNKKWLDSLKTLPPKSQIAFILQRIILDTNVFIRYSYADRIKVDYTLQEKTKFEGCCKPIIILEPTSTVFNFDSKFKKLNLFTEITTLKQTLSEIIIDEVKILPQSEATAIWGWQAEHGAILLKISNKQSIKLLKKRFKYHH